MLQYTSETDSAGKRSVVCVTCGAEWRTRWALEKIHHNCVARTPSSFRLTIGMAVYDDYDGVYFTVQSLRMHHAEAMKDCEIVVVDNNPGSSSGKATKSFATQAGCRYVDMPEPVGTSQSRNRIFTEARGDSVLVMDSHVLLPPGVVSKLIAYYDQNPSTKNLLSGPLLYDDLRCCATQFDDEWRGEMWGVWGYDEREKLGDPFEVTGMGLGLFSCRRDAWLRFNPKFRGFGGEEMYIHEKYRKAGRKCLCIPWLRWTHRFGRPNGVHFPVTRLAKVRNYIIGLSEIGLPMDRCYSHFVGGGLISHFQWEELVVEATGLSSDEIAGLLPGCDPTLIGNRIASLTAAIGFPPCGSCAKRKRWMNDAHQWLRGLL